MATRVCGRVKINCVYRDRTSDYQCSLSVNGQRRGTEFVGIPRSLQVAVDSPKAYDDTAHAALSFALSEGKISEDELDLTDSGYRIQRGTPKKR